jgi:hypothetical protein
MGAEKDGVRKDQKWGLIYGGVRGDCDVASSLFNKKETSDPSSNMPEWLEKSLTVGFLALDFPLSAVGDTVTLPKTILYTLDCQNASGIDTPDADSAPSSP